MHQDKEDENTILRVNDWLDNAVIGLGLCPFANAPRQRDAIRFVVSHARDDEAVLRDLADECLKLSADKSIETTLLIIAKHLQLFDDFNQFLSLADGLLAKMGWAREYQIASFHPHYQFAYSAYEDRGNWTNRAPLPVLHLLRESSVSHAVRTNPFTRQIPSNNIATLNRLDESVMQEIFAKGRQIPEE